EPECPRASLDERGDARADRGVAAGEGVLQALVPGGMQPELDREQAPVAVGAGSRADARDRVEAGLGARCLLERNRYLVEPTVETRVENGEEDRVLACEVGVDGSLAVAGALGDLLERAAGKAAPGEDVRRALDD